MKNLRVTLAAIAICVAMLLPTSLFATPSSPYILIAGSSAMFNTMGYAAFEASPFLGGAYLCGANHWSYKDTSSTSFVVIHDGRSASIPDEKATIWVAWDGLADGSTATKVCAYANLDSTIGVRSVMAVPQANLALTVAGGTAGQNKVLGASVADVAIPASIIAALNNQPIQIGAADIRAEDAKFATARALTAQGTNMPSTLLTYVKGLGYGGVATGVGYAIKSSQSGTNAIPVDFALFGNDPISGQSAWPFYSTLSVGSGPIMVFANTSNSAAGHLGDSSLSNINSFVLSGFLDGSFSRTRDLFSNSTTLGEFPVKTYLREPLSGTYNTMEFNVPASYRVLSTQEKNVINVAPLPAADNPLQQAGSVTGSGRFRVVGTGEMVSTVLANADSLGYAFWGYGNFGNATSGSVARYFTVDGVDPLYSGPSANPNGVGVFPLKCTASGVPFASCTGGSFPYFPSLSFPNIQNGSYPIWTTFRLIVPGTANFSTTFNVASLLIQVAQNDMASKISDFVPSTSMKVFRSHFFQQGIGPENGTRQVAGSPGQFYPDEGGEVGGAVFPLQADYDSLTDTNLEIWQRHQ